MREKTIKIISLRVKKSVSLEASVLFTIKLPAGDIDIDNITWIGWEPNEQGKYIPKCASLSSSMDPQKYIHILIMLKTKNDLIQNDLIQQVGRDWRVFKSKIDEMAPIAKFRLGSNLNYEMFTFWRWNTWMLGGSKFDGGHFLKPLTFLCGNFTLESDFFFSKFKQAWGIQHISFLDSGNVSFSNPVRQSLFTYKDAEERLEKAKTAAFRVNEIHPGIVSIDD